MSSANLHLGPERPRPSQQGCLRIHPEGSGQPDGSKQQLNCDVMQLITLAGEEDNETIFKFTLYENGVPTDYTGTLTEV